MDRINPDCDNVQSSGEVDCAVLLERDGNTRLLRELESGSWVMTDVEDLQSQTDSEGQVQVIGYPVLSYDPYISPCILPYYYNIYCCHTQLCLALERATVLLLKINTVV